jgi:hypothetical protein
MYSPRTHNREPSQGARDHQLAGVAGPAAAEYPPRYLLVGLGWLQRAQAASADLDHLVNMPPAGLLHPRHPSPPRTIALVAFPGEQMPDDAARHLDQRRRPRFPFPRHDSSMRNHVRYDSPSLARGRPLTAPKLYRASPEVRHISLICTTGAARTWPLPTVTRHAARHCEPARSATEVDAPSEVHYFDR